MWSGKCPVGEMSARRNVLVGKCPVGKVSFGEVSGRGIVRWGNVRRLSVRQGSVSRGIVLGEVPVGELSSRGTVRIPNLTRHLLKNNWSFYGDFIADVSTFLR